MSDVAEVLVVAVSTFAVSSGGFWAYLKTRRETMDRRNDATTKLLMGLGQDKILFLGMKYIERGWVTNEEYQDLREYLFTPYVQLGGNGTAERMMRAIEALPLRPSPTALPISYPRGPEHEDK